MKNIITKSTLLLASSAMLASSLFAKETSTTIIVHHFMSAKAPTHTKLLMPWAKKIEEDSKGKIKVEIYPSLTMGGKPNELYKQARDGVADIVWTLAGYTPGVFPRTEVYELPTVHKGDSYATTVAIRENMDLIKDDFKGVKPLLIHAAAGNAIHTTEKKILKVSDLKGLKLRTPSRTGAWLIDAYGAEPVGMPLPVLPQALSKNAIDGALVPFEVFPPYKFHQLTKYSAEGVNKERFGTSIFMMLMNEDKFNNLSKELQDIILANSGMELSKSAGNMWMQFEEPGKKMQAGSKGSEVVKITTESLKEFDAVGQTIVDRWIKEVSKRNIDGQKLVDKAREAILRNSK